MRLFLFFLLVRRYGAVVLVSPTGQQVRYRREVS